MDTEMKPEDAFAFMAAFAEGAAEAIAALPVKSDGGSTDYYKIPAGATDLIDLIELKGMSFGVGNIFKACYRLGSKDGTTAAYDLRKIIFFAERALKQIENKNG